MRAPTTLKLCSAVLSALLISGCSSVDSDDSSRAPAPLADFNEERELDRAWKTSVGNGQGDLFNRLQIAVNNGVVYAAAANGDVAAISLSEGDELWESELDTELTGATGVGPNLVLVASAQGDVVALDRQSGAEKWRHSMGGEVLAAPQSNGSVVVVQTFDGRVVGLSAESGEPLWNYSVIVPALSLRGTATPLLIEDYLVTGFANGQLVALDIATGRLRWESRVALAQGSTEIERLVDVDGQVMRSGNLLFAVGYQGRIVAIDLSSGRRVWTREASSHVGMAEGFGNVYVVGEDGSVNAFAKSGQELRWTQTALSYRGLSAPATWQSYVVVGDKEGYVHLLSQVDGHLVAREKVDGSGIQAPMVVVDDKLLVFGNSGKLVAYQLEEQ